MTGVGMGSGGGGGSGVVSSMMALNRPASSLALRSLTILADRTEEGSTPSSMARSLSGTSPKGWSSQHTPARWPWPRGLRGRPVVE